LINLKTDYVAEALARLPAQFKDATEFKALVSAFIAEVQELENALFDLGFLKDIDLMDGDALDLLGKLFGVSRKGRADVDYRIVLKGQSLLLNTSGESERIRLVLRAMIPGAEPRVLDVGEAAFTAYMDSVELDSPIETGAIVRQARAAGVSGFVFWQTTDDANTFCFDTGPGLGYDEGEYAGIVKA
jgi:hypothetical protein